MMSRASYALLGLLLGGLLLMGHRASPQSLSGVSLVLQQIATGLAYPVAITHANDGSGRLFITLQNGKIVIYNGTQILPTPFLDISSLVACCGESGLLSVAFHPNYATNGFFYVFYTNLNGDLVIARYSRSSGNPNVADPTSALILLTIPHPTYNNHNGGQLQFGPDGYLYIATGDGGGSGDPFNNGQNKETLLGKILRIDVNSGSPYGIPPTNPFVNQPGADEIWAYGLRNPWRFSFDRLTGDLFIADVGQNNWEEVNFQAANSAGGQNYGWRLMEGAHCYNPPTNCNDGTLTLPILEYSHAFGCSITGGYRYRGTKIPVLYGAYLYGDYCSGRIWGAIPTGSSWTATQLIDTPYNISTFGEDENGEIYLAHHHASAGAIYKIVGVTTAALFRIERATGNVYTDGAFFAGGADLAEYISVSEPVEPGDLVELDPTRPKSYRKSRTPYSALIAGVIATQPGVVLGAQGERVNERTALLALLGRVPVKVTTENGPIRPGDLLTSSSQPGYAMRCRSPRECEGAIVGKALQSLDSGAGIILALLTR
ncbi:MAG: PQQ-dependent sugar dehydrogenase [Candidatus Bipolaricaulota bacterium]|nr:PQQ-dependent sugar dehydrogenase [Candidatus Bipolaricaulota bacterium]MCS7275214.1 PQQ-dependent sugar dehydrogenase [Candidatus Bipolaricaulota bacterium]MDW8110490.1 PQQ-dependent sugar dehydrogenase [Candidatus Bipolaricaulota bacterium]MDW8329171.1 PQQ-dependent sugar dehydrogenase [Candidatus Bipolaricaulota bacterium]